MKAIGLGILYIIGTIILAVIIALTTIFSYFPLQLYLFGRGNYLLFSSSKINMVPIFMIMILMIYGLFVLKEKIFSQKYPELELQDEDELEEDRGSGKLEKFVDTLLDALLTIDEIALKLFRIVRISYIPLLLIAIYAGMTSYAILFTDSIKVSTPINPTGKTYRYTDVNSVDVGVVKGYKNSYNPYYKLIFKDGKSVDFFEGSMQDDRGIGFEYILIDLDKKLKVQGVHKSVNKNNFYKYAKDLDEDFIRRVEKLFDE